MAKKDPYELQFLDDATLVSFADLVAASGLAMELVVELAEHGVFEPVDRGMRAQPPAEWRVTSHSLFIARRAARLRQDFGLDTSGIALALSLLERIDELERRLHDLQCQLPR